MPNNRLHVLIIGVSEYLHLPGVADPMTPHALGLRKLSSPALSAFRVHQWLRSHEKELPLPLGDVFLLLSPSQAEIAADANLSSAQAAGSFLPCTLQNVQKAAEQWRNAAAVDPGEMTWFYFGGHGVQRSKNDAVLLLEDFGQGFGGALQHAIDVNTLFNGMAPSASRSDIARRQIYFVDACRMIPKEFKKIETQNPSQVFLVELSGQDDRRAPIFFATVSGATAEGFKAKPSLFTEVLLQCLNGSAGKPVDDDRGNVLWMVTSGSMPNAMRTFFDEWRRYGRVDQAFTVGGLVPEEVPLRTLPGPPQVEVLVDIDPDVARNLASLNVTETATLTSMPLRPPGPPFEVRWPAGIYRLQVNVDPHPTFVAPPPSARQLLPPRGRLIGKVLP